MARPKSDEKRTALLQAASRVIDKNGLGASTASIAQEAGVANGTLFNYFASKSELLNELYLDLKAEMAGAALGGLSAEDGPREQLLHVWMNWMRWAVAHPEKRRAMAQLAASEEISPATREEAGRAMLKIGALIERTRAEGPMRDAPMELLAKVIDAIAAATMDHMTQDPAHADEHSKTSFEIVWRIVGDS